MGDEEAVMMERPFQSMNAVESTSAKLSACVMVWRALARCGERAESMTGEDRKVGKRGLQKKIKDFSLDYYKFAPWRGSEY